MNVSEFLALIITALVVVANVFGVVCIFVVVRNSLEKFRKWIGHFTSPQWVK